MSQSFQRVVVIGAGGFVGQTLLGALAPLAQEVVAVGRAQADLAAEDGAAKLAALLREGDRIVFLSAVTPDKAGEQDILAVNLKIAASFITAIAKVPPAHVVYLSSDAVYPFGTKTITEATPTRADNPYAEAHMQREAMFRAALGEKLTILRPTLIYGPGDTHSSYGPSRLCREGLESGLIQLFGEGEELRDHVFIKDVVAAITGSLVHTPQGPLNVASGDPIHYAELAAFIADEAGRDVEVKGRERKQAITHREFDIAALLAALPGHTPTPIREGVAVTLKALKA